MQFTHHRSQADCSAAALWQPSVWGVFPGDLEESSSTASWRLKYKCSFSHCEALHGHTYTSVTLNETLTWWCPAILCSHANICELKSACRAWGWCSWVMKMWTWMCTIHIHTGHRVYYDYTSTHHPSGHCPINTFPSAFESQRGTLSMHVIFLSGCEHV